MRVLFITRKFPPSVGGMELFARDLSQSLSKQNEIELVKWGGSNKWLPLIIPYLFLKSIWILLTQRPEIIHIQDGLLAPIGYLLSKIFRRPYMVIIHGLDITHDSVIYQKLIVPFTARANKVICISSAAKEECIKRGVPPSNLEVITLAVQDNIYPKLKKAELPQSYKIPDDAPVLLTVGRLVKRKGVAWFCSECLPELVQDFPDLKYLVIGDGQEMPNIEDVIRAKQLEDNVILVGRASDDDLASAYARANIFVMPNINITGDIEGFGLVSLEAALCELPIVAAKTEGIVDAISDQKNGILVQPEDVKSFINELVKLLKNPDQARELGKKARIYTQEHYRWEEIAKQYGEQYLQLTEQNT